MMVSIILEKNIKSDKWRKQKYVTNVRNLRLIIKFGVKLQMVWGCQ